MTNTATTYSIGGVMVDKAWTIEKKLPIGIMAAVALQTLAFVWWASGMYHQILSHEIAIAELRSSDVVMNNRFTAFLAERALGRSDALQRISRVEQSMDDIKTALGRIDSKLDGLRNRTNP